MPIVPQGRVCTHCGEWKPASEFKRVTGQPHKLRSHCRVCTLAEQQVLRNRLVTRICSDCGREYQGRNGQSRFCDPCGTARRFANLEQREQMRLVCQRCGVLFPSESSKHKYCSRECKRRAAIGATIPSKGNARPHTWRAATRVCLGCNKEFRAIKDTKREKQIYCSHRCYLRCRKVSHFENCVMDMIEAAGYKVERQAKRGRWSFDGALVGSNILIEADGVYWHSSPKVVERDARKDKWAVDNGYILLRVPEMAFYKDAATEINVILRRAEAEGLECVKADE